MNITSLSINEMKIIKDVSVTTLLQLLKWIDWSLGLNQSVWCKFHKAHEHDIKEFTPHTTNEEINKR